MDIREMLIEFRLATDNLAIGAVDEARSSFERLSARRGTASALQLRIAEQANATLELMNRIGTQSEGLDVSTLRLGFYCRLFARDSRCFPFRGFYRQTLASSQPVATEETIRQRLSDNSSILISAHKVEESGKSADDTKVLAPGPLDHAETQFELRLMPKFAGIAWQEKPLEHSPCLASIRVSPFFQVSGEIQWLGPRDPGLDELKQAIARMLRRLVKDDGES